MWTVLAAACVCPRGLAAVRRRARAFHDAGGSLDRLIARNDREGAFDELAVALWLVQLALGIAHMHARRDPPRPQGSPPAPRRAAPRFHSRAQSRRRLDGTCRACAAGQHLHEPQRRTQDRRPRGLQLVARPEESPCGAPTAAPSTCARRSGACGRAPRRATCGRSAALCTSSWRCARPSPRPNSHRCCTRHRSRSRRLLGGAARPRRQDAREGPRAPHQLGRAAPGCTCSAISRAGCASPAHHRRGLRHHMRSRGRRATTWARVGA